MVFTEIALPPREPKVFYLKIVPQKIARFERASKNLLRILNRLGDADILSDYLSDALPNLNQDYLTYSLKQDHLEHIKYMINSLKSLWERQTFQYIINAIEGADFEGLQKIADTISSNESEIYKQFKEYNKMSPRFYEHLLPKELPKSLLDFAYNTISLIPFLKDVKEKTERIISFSTKGRDPSGYEIPPEHEDVETLYHASAKAKQIYQEGFKDLPEEDKSGGLGGSLGTKDPEKKGIAFTSDFYVAKEIARSLKEVIGIANGQYDFRDVLHWAKQDDVDDKTLFGALSGREKKKREFGEPLYAKPQLYDKENVFRMYRNYLLASPKRYDPLFIFVSIKNFEGLDPADVGIVKAKVDMTNEAILYLRSMYEFRVPVEAVIEITGFIGERGAEVKENKILQNVYRKLLKSSS